MHPSSLPSEVVTALTEPVENGSCAAGTQLSWTDYDFSAPDRFQPLWHLAISALRNEQPIEVLLRLARDLKATGRTDCMAFVYRSALARVPDSLPARLGFAQTLRDMGQTQKALDLLSSVSPAPATADFHFLLGSLLAENDRAHEAEQALRECIQLDPTHERAHYELCTALVKQGKPEEASSVCRLSTIKHGQNTTNLAMSCVLSSLLGQQEQLDNLLEMELIEYGEVVSNQEDQLARLNRALAACLSSHPSMVFEPKRLATRAGHQAEIDQVLPKELSAPVVQMIRAQVERYLSSLPPDHQLSRRCPIRPRLNAWAVVLHDQGWQRPHIHPSAWLSGVYYVQVPESEGDAGAIEIGRLPEKYAGAATPKTLMIRPAAGRMLLFPSYFYHRTVPVSSTNNRICIAFDVL